MHLLNTSSNGFKPKTSNAVQFGIVPLFSAVGLADLLAVTGERLKKAAAGWSQLRVLRLVGLAFAGVAHIRNSVGLLCRPAGAAGAEKGKQTTRPDLFMVLPRPRISRFRIFQILQFF